MSFFGTASRVQEPAPQPEEEKQEALEQAEALPPTPETVIAKGVVISGELRGTGSVRIEGLVKGSICLSGTLIVAAFGEVQGPVEADAIRVAGHVKGNVTAREHLRLEAGGTIEGDVTTATLGLDPGGILNGRTTMLKPPPAPVPEEDVFRLDGTGADGLDGTV